MATFAEEIAGALAELREQYIGFDMTYQRGATSIPLTQVVKGKSVFRFTDAYGLSVHTETHDILVDVSQLGGIEPRSGDQVTEIIETDGLPVATETFNVVSINKERVWYYSDIGRTTMRIHTVLLKREPI